MFETRQPIAVSEAVGRVLKEVLPIGTEYLPIEECDERVLAEDILADHDAPPFDRSPYDGFAIRAEDTASASGKSPVALEVIEEIGAGELAKRPIDTSEAIRIMTGAAIPDGGNAIIMFERVQEMKRDGKPYILISDVYSYGDNLSKQGEDTEKDTIQVEKGRAITPGMKAVLATFGYAQVKVSRQPVVGIYATGTELLEVDEDIVLGKIRNSNAYSIASQVKKAGAIPRYLGQLKDDFTTCFEAVRKALDEVDVLITTGGVSVGDYDYLPSIYEKLGAEVCFNKVAMRPGSVTTVAKWRGKTLFGLSGNPSACFVGFELFTRPVLKTMLGAGYPYLQKAQALLEIDFPKANPFTRFVRGKVTIKEGKLVAKPVGLDKSNAVTPLAHANAFIVLSGGMEGHQKGVLVDVLLLNGECGEWTVK